MNKWLTSIGVTLLIIAVILISPLSDYLPIDFWGTLNRAINNILSSESKHVYYKVVPTTEESRNIHIYVLVALGVIFVVLGKVYTQKPEKK